MARGGKFTYSSMGHLKVLSPNGFLKFVSQQKLRLGGPDLFNFEILRILRNDRRMGLRSEKRWGILWFKTWQNVEMNLRREWQLSGQEKEMHKKKPYRIFSSGSMELIIFIWLLAWPVSQPWDCLDTIKRGIWQRFLGDNSYVGINL